MVHVKSLFLLTLHTMVILMVLLSFISNDGAGDQEVDCRVVGSYGGAYHDVAYDGEYLYAAHTLGLSIFDISGPSNPEKIGFCLTAGIAYDVTVNGDYAYVADWENGLVIVNVSDKTNPTEIGHFDTPGSAYGVAVSGNYAYIADHSKGLVILDISEKSNPLEIGRYYTAGSAHSVSVNGDYAYVADEGNGLVIVNISNKTDPTEIGHYNTAGTAYDVTVSGDFAYVADGVNGLVIVDITNKNNPTEKGQCDTGGHSRGIFVIDDNAYAADGTSVVIVDISDKENPLEKGQCDNTASNAKGVVVVSNWAYIAYEFSGIAIIDFSNEENPSEAGHFNTVPAAYDVMVSGNYAYVGDLWGGLIIVDISDRENPIGIGNWDIPGTAYGVTIDGEYAYIAGASYGLFIIDISDKSNPHEKGRYNTSGCAMSVIVKGDFAYVADTQNGLIILNISDKEAPFEVGHFKCHSSVYDVEVYGEFAYITDSSYGLVILDISDKGNPTEVGRCDTESAASVMISGECAFVADRDNGFVVVDISDKENPTSIGHYENTGYTECVVANGDCAYVGDRSNSFVVVDVSDMDNISEIGRHDTRNTAWCVMVTGNYTYVAFGSEGLIIMELAPIATIKSITPNPALDTNTVHFTGNGTDNGTIERYSWRANDIELYNGTNSEFSYSDLSPGTYSIYLKVQDNSGIWSDEIRETLIVHARPIASIESITPNPALVNDVIHFNGNGTDDGTIARYSWRTDDNELYNDTNSVFTCSDLPIGSYSIYLKVQDDFGIWSDEVQETLIVHEKPIALIENISPNPALDTDIIQFNGTGYDADGIFTQFIWNSSIDGEIHNSTETANFTCDLLSKGTHNVTFKVQDTYGIWSNEVSATVTVNGKPQAFIDTISPEQSVEGENVSFEGHGTDDGSIIQYVWHSSRDGILFNATNSTFTLSNLSNGTHIISLKVMDNNGIWSEEVETTIAVNGIPRAYIEIISPNPAEEGQHVTFTGSGTDDGFVTLYSWRSDPGGPLYNDTNVSFSLSNLSVGNHTVYLRVRDDHGAWSEEVAAVLRVKERSIPENKRPTVSITDPKPGEIVTGNITISGLASDEDGTIQIVEMSIDNETWTIVTGTESWTFEWNTAELENGEYTIRARCYDGEDFSDVVNITVTVENNEDEGIDQLPLIGYISIVIVVTVVGIAGVKRRRRKSEGGIIPGSTASLPETPDPSLPLVQSIGQQQLQTGSQPHHSPPAQYPTSPPQQQVQMHYVQSQAPTHNLHQAPAPPVPTQSTAGSIWVCPGCGNQSEDKFRFCMNCGFKR